MTFYRNVPTYVSTLLSLMAGGRGGEEAIDNKCVACRPRNVTNSDGTGSGISRRCSRRTAKRYGLFGNADESAWAEDDGRARSINGRSAAVEIRSFRKPRRQRRAIGRPIRRRESLLLCTDTMVTTTTYNHNHSVHWALPCCDRVPLIPLRDGGAAAGYWYVLIITRI